jgi:predicted ester cyclase
MLIQDRRFESLGWKIRFLLGLVICFSLLMFSIEVPAMAEQMTSSQVKSELSQTNKAIALRYAKEGWGTQPNWEKVWDELVSPNFVQHFNSFPQTIVGLENNKQFTQGLFEGMPDAKSTIEDVIAEGNMVVYRSTIRGTHTGNFLGYSPTGKSTKLNDFTQLKIENGKIVEMWYETNLLSGLQQLGLVPEQKEG